MASTIFTARTSLFMRNASRKHTAQTISLSTRFASANASIYSLCTVNTHRQRHALQNNVKSSCRTKQLPQLRRDLSLISFINQRNFHQACKQLSQQAERAEKKKSEISEPAPSTDSTLTKPKTRPTEILRRISESAIPATRHENIYTIPNILTFTRLLAAPAVGYFILHHQAWPAMLLFFYAGVTDAVDGYLARRYNQQTVVGTVIDPMADKALMMISVVALGWTGIFPWWLATIIIGRDVALAISAIYFRWISLPPPKTMARYWDFSLPSAEVHPTEISKINTFLQLLLVGNGMLLPVLPVELVSAYNLQGIFEGWQFLVASTTVWSGLSYIFNKDAVKILSQEEVREKEQEKAEEKAYAERK